MSSFVCTGPMHSDRRVTDLDYLKALHSLSLAAGHNALSSIYNAFHYYSLSAEQNYPYGQNI